MPQDSSKKRRELKARVVDDQQRKRGQGIDYNDEIPCKKKPQPGFNDVVEEDRPVDQPKFPIVIHANKLHEEKIEEDVSERIVCERAEEEARQQALLRKQSKVLQRELPRPPTASIELIRHSLMRDDEGKSSFIPPNDSGEGSSSQGGSGHLAGSSGGGSQGSSWVHASRQKKETTSSSSPQRTQTRILEIQLPNDQSLQPSKYLLAVNLAKTQKYAKPNGIAASCSDNISLSSYYLHFLLVDPEPKMPVQAPYDDQIPPSSSDLDKQMLECWASFKQPVVKLWRGGRWGNHRKGHGIRQPNFDQELYFQNACTIFQSLDLKETMDKIAFDLACERVDHFEDSWREVKASSLKQELNRKFGCTPKLKCELIDGRFCLFEVVFKLSGDLQLLSFAGDEWCDRNFHPNEYILI